MSSHPYVGQRVSSYFNNKVYEGTVVKVIDPYTVLSKEEMQEYTGLQPGDTAYKSVRGPSRVERLVMRRVNGTHVVSPTRLFLR